MAPVYKSPKSFVERATITTDPQQRVTEYFLSKNEERRGVKKYPEWDIPRVCPAHEVIKARRDLRLAEKQLKDKRAEEQIRRKAMDEQWDEMRRQELVLRQSFIKFNKFVRENQEKRERAENKSKEELERQIQRQAEIDDLTEKLNHMTDVRNKMKHHVEEYTMYQAYLERVVNEVPEFQSVNEIFNRYETLVDAREVLQEHQDQHLQALEDTGTEIYQMTEARSQMLLAMNNQLADLQDRYERAKAQALKWEGVVARIKTTAAEKNLELTRVRSCCWNIYQQICKRKNISPAGYYDNIEQQLSHIKRTILELKRIIKTAKKKAAQEEKSRASLQDEDA